MWVLLDRQNTLNERLIPREDRTAAAMLQNEAADLENSEEQRREATPAFF
jgi:hypothetical protein